MKSVKKPISFRLPDATLAELSSLAGKYGVSKAQVLAVLVHLFSVHEDVLLDDARAMFDTMKLG